MKKPTTSTPPTATNVPSAAAARQAYLTTRELGDGRGLVDNERTSFVLSWLFRERCSADSCARRAEASGLPLLEKKVRDCDICAAGPLLQRGEALAAMCEARDSDAACRGSIAA
jgi:hypothetical protein